MKTIYTITGIDNHMMHDFVLNLQDMTPDEIFADKKFAQELELSK